MDWTLGLPPCREVRHPFPVLRQRQVLGCLVRDDRVVDRHVSPRAVRVKAEDQVEVGAPVLDALRLGKVRQSRPFRVVIEQFLLGHLVRVVAEDAIPELDEGRLHFRRLGGRNQGDPGKDYCNEDRLSIHVIP